MGELESPVQPDSFDVLEQFDLQQHEIWIDTYSSKYVLSWEYLRYRVTDHEERTLSFYSQGFEAQLVEEKRPPAP
ncbi:hypothetical protein KSF_083800 [Reticulibacter mediterranei]|uniref:Uncharacterized protein n=1 Tax=Reticulibacter mediterranei TaxID=2778369 RepID=A0A8J3N4L4_9CHLR|nr:hypothetical protein KSF_083800 [Reticulibacter mediterranei]